MQLDLIINAGEGEITLGSFQGYADIADRMAAPNGRKHHEVENSEHSEQHLSLQTPEPNVEHRQ